MMNVFTATAVVVVALATVACGGGDTALQGGEQTAPGADRTPKTTALEGGAAALQAKAPVDQIALYLVGFYPDRADP